MSSAKFGECVVAFFTLFTQNFQLNFQCDLKWGKMHYNVFNAFCIKNLLIEFFNNFFKGTMKKSLVLKTNNKV